MPKSNKAQSLSHNSHSKANKSNKVTKNESSTAIFRSMNASVHFVDKVDHMDMISRQDLSYLKCNSEHKNKDPPFKPQIHQIPYTLYPDKWQNLLKSKRDHWQELIQDNRSRNYQRTQKKLKQEQAKFKQFKFSPSISKFQVEGESQNKENVYNKLYEEAQIRKQQRIQIERQNLEKQNAQLQKYKCKDIKTDKWTILNKQKFDLSPLYTRLQKVIEQKKKNRKILVQEGKEQFAFKPKIDKNSKKIAQKNEVSNVVDRLIDDYKKKANKIDLLTQKYELELKKRLTFRPEINNYMPNTIQKGRKQPKVTPVQYNFMPTINQLSALLTQDRYLQTQDQKLFRMHNAPVMSRVDKINKIEAEVYADCRFNPEINQISKQINNTQVKHHLCPIKQPQSATHKPMINQISQCMTESKRAKSLDNIKKKVKQKAEIYKKTVQYCEMKECSFKPKIKDNKIQRQQSNNKKSLQDVAGFKKFYENIEKAVAKEQRKKQLEQKLFQLQKNYDRRRAKMITVDRSNAILTEQH